MQKAKRYFNTSGPNIIKEHYTLLRSDLVTRGEEMVKRNRYFTIWAPRQTGKSTYFQLLANQLREEGYQVLQISVESYFNAREDYFLRRINEQLEKQTSLSIAPRKISELEGEFSAITQGKLVIIVDEIEGLNPELFGPFLHSIRQLYHSRLEHSLKSVILVGVSNIVGVVEDHASPFNIADNLEIPYFTEEETFDLLHQHEEETGQLFEEKVKAKISEITANQPGLVNGFAYQLVERNKGKQVIHYEDYLEVEDWYLHKVIDKNVANILKYARKFRPFVERLLFTEEDIHFDIDREEIKILHTNGLIKDDPNGNVMFWVPLYKKRIYSAFYPYTNGEKQYFFNRIENFFDLVKGGRIDFEFLIQNYKDYVKRRSFKAFREKDPETGEYKSMREAALKYSFETYISLFLQHIEAQSYTEPGTGLGRSDILVNYQGQEYVIETKIYRYPLQVQKGLKQLAYYCNSINIYEGLYMVFASNKVPVKGISEGTQEIDGVKIRVYIVDYDEEKDF
ncbi:MAG: ATP-binding protein [Bacteroidetes bacterium]|nr:ATP-binding protein [Bacteroidota bacterium]MCB0845047.1 ATP-binding protein [Bacteroidota bacterium]